MGPLSVLVRAPFAAVVGGDELQRYRAGVLACLFVLVALGVALAFGAANRWLGALGCVAIVVMPPSLRPLDWGHPEELMTVALVIAAALAAARGWSGWAGLAVGAAVACKLWALAAIPVALLLLPPAQRARAAVVALGVVVVLYAPYFALDPGAFGDNAKAAGKIGSAPGTVSIANVWFPFANTVDFDAPTGFGADGRVQTARVNGYELPRAVGRLAHLLILLAGTGLALWWLSRGRPAALDGALLVVALALLARCVLDPGTFSYYHAPLLVTLVARDALAKRPPWLSVVALGSFELVARLLPHVSNVHTFNAIYLAWGAGLAALMATVMLRQE